MIFISAGTSTYRFARLERAVEKIVRDYNGKVFFQNGVSHPVEGAISIPMMEFAKFCKLAADCDYFFSHCGIGNVILAKRLEKKCLFMPRSRMYDEHCDNHQIDLAEMLISTGRANCIFPHEEFNPTLLYRAHRYSDNHRNFNFQEAVAETVLKYVR